MQMLSCPCAVLSVPFTASQIDPDWVKTAARPFDPPLTEYGEEQVQPVAQPVACQYLYAACISISLGCLANMSNDAGAVSCGKVEAVRHPACLHLSLLQARTVCCSTGTLAAKCRAGALLTLDAPTAPQSASPLQVHSDRQADHRGVENSARALDCVRRCVRGLGLGLHPCPKAASRVSHRFAESCMSANKFLAGKGLTARAVGAQFLNPMILVKKGGKLPEGHIQSWFWERGNLKESLALKLPAGAHPSAWVTTTERLSVCSRYATEDLTSSPM